MLQVNLLRDGVVRSWMGRWGLDTGTHDDGLTSAEREELRRLRKENRQLRTER